MFFKALSLARTIFKNQVLNLEISILEICILTREPDILCLHFAFRHYYYFLQAILLETSYYSTARYYVRATAIQTTLTLEVALIGRTESQNILKIISDLIFLLVSA